MRINQWTNGGKFKFISRDNFMEMIIKCIKAQNEWMNECMDQSDGIM